MGTQFSAPNINRRSVLHFDLAELKELKQSRNPVLINRQESRQIVDWFSPRLYITVDWYPARAAVAVQQAYPTFKYMILEINCRQLTCEECV